MNKLHTIPAADGFRMPGEFEPHRGCIMIWPKRPGSWNYGAKKAREAFKRVAWAIAEERGGLYAGGAGRGGEPIPLLLPLFSCFFFHLARPP